MKTCRQLCPWNTLYGCKKPENEPCILSNMACEKFEQKPQTNADHIRSMTDEELADYMSEHAIDDFCYIICGGECKAIATFNKTPYQRCREIVADWLKQPYGGDT